MKIKLLNPYFILASLLIMLLSAGASAKNKIQKQKLQAQVPPFSLVNVPAVLSPPTAINDTFSVAEDNTLTITNPLLGVLANDSDIDGDNLSVSPILLTAPANGTITINADGTLVYTPNPNFNGTDSVEYEVCDDAAIPECSSAFVFITITAVNDAPVALNDIAAPDASEDTPYSGTTVLLNDTDLDLGDLLSVSTIPVVAPLHGSVTLNGDGTYTYTAVPNYFGVDTFSYQVCDNGAPQLCAVASVAIAITGVPDPPALVNDLYSTNEDSPLNGSSVLANDLEFDNQLLILDISPFTLPTHGSLTIAGDGTFLYTPTANFNGTDSFDYQVCDDGIPAECSVGTVSITINPLNDAPFGANDLAITAEDVPLNGSSVLLNDTDPETDPLTVSTTPVTNVAHGTLVLNADGTYLYTSSSNYFGPDFFVYTVCDNQFPAGCSDATVNLTVNAINDAPVGTNDIAATVEDIVLNGATVLTNDFDVDGNPLSVTTTPVIAPLNGILNLNSNGTFTYTPNANFNGTDSFTYQVCDNEIPSLCATASVTITISAFPDAPVAANDNYAIGEDALLNGTSVLINDTDGDADLMIVNTNPITNVTNGLLVLNSDGTFIYIPAANFNGTDSFVYEVCDTTGLCATATAIISVSAVNDAPAAVNDGASVNEDAILNGSSVLSNDSDIEGNLLSVNITPLVAPLQGILTLNVNGTYMYTPSANFNGNESFVYQVCDNAIPSACSSATVNITVNSVNDIPLAVADAASTNEDVVLIGTSLIANDSDVDGNTLSINTTPLVNPTNGSLLINANGTYTYTPGLNFNGTDSFIYQVCDNGSPSLCATATVTLTVTGQNDLPIALDDAASTAEDTPLNGATVLINDSDPDLNPLTVSTLPITAPLHGIVNINSNGTYLYTPNLNYNGADNFVYQVCDNAAPAGCSNASVFISISAVNDVPTALPNAYSTNEDSPLNGTSVLVNDVDSDGDLMTVNTSPISSPANGVLTLNADGTFTYLPNANYSGSDSFTYEVCDNAASPLCATAVVTLTINPVNDAPIAVNGSYTTSEDNTLNGSTVLANDSDPDGNLLTVNTVPVVNVSSGLLTLNADGTFIYLPTLNFSGTVSFTYQVCDNAIPSLCSTAITTIDVIAVNDAPNATADAYSTNEDTPLNGSSVLANDFDVEAGIISVNPIPFASPLHGVLSLNVNGTFTYTPNSNYFGSDSFVYQICDNGTPSLCTTATVTINVLAVNDTPIATFDNGTTLENTTLNGTTVLANDTDPENGVLTVTTVPVTNVAHGILILNANGTYSYTPSLNYNGFDFFIYEVCDNGIPISCATATVTISIGSVNQFPVANNNSLTTNEDTPNSDNVLINDSDPDLDILTVTAFTNFPTLHGSITIASNGAYTYTPNLNYNGPDNFTYQVCDNGTPSLCSNASINITVTAINDAPVAVNDNVTSPEDAVLNGTSLLTNDSDVDGNPLTASPTPLVPPTHGTVLINANGTYTYTPNLNYVGGDTFVYEVCDNALPPSCSNAVVLITISAVNDAPSATADAYSTNEDVVLSGSSVLVNDFDQDGNSLSVTGIAITPPAFGNLVLNANGTFIYTPFANYNGPDSFVYQMCDNAVPSLCATATVSITVNAINDAPLVVSDAASTAEDTPLNGTSLLFNDFDVDGNPLTINTSPAVNPIQGSVVINSNGTYLYTPNLNYNGSDSFTYQVCDNGTPVLCATAVVSLTISSVNDLPVANADVAITNEDTPLNGTTVLSNDTDPDGNPLVITTTPITPPIHGTLSLNANGTYSYIPTANYNGTDSFVYQICDNAIPALCATAPVLITINAVNDAPLAVNDSYSTSEDVLLSGTSLVLNDTDPEGGLLVVTTVAITNPIHGSLTINANGTFLYTPFANYNGIDSFLYQVCDAGIPVACATSTAFISINAVNDAPIAVDDNASTLEDTPLNGSNLVLNDTDPDSNPLTINTTPITNPANGTVTINANGTYSYTPNLGYSGFDSFVYQVCDNGIPALCDNAIVTIGIGAVNHAPTAVNEAFTTSENTTINNTLSTNDSDPDGNNLVYTATPVVPPADGSVTINSNGTFSYIPNLNFSGFDSFTYQVCDDGVPSLCATATATITIVSVNDAPLANFDAVNAVEDTPLTGISLLLNDSDPDGNSLSISTTPVSTVLNGILVINANGTFSYTPNTNFTGTDSFVYQICDNGIPALCDTAFVFITVAPVNDAPLAANDNANTFVNTLVSGNVLTNDTDSDGPLLFVSVLMNVSNGTMQLNANGAFSYTPNLNFTGKDTLTYLVCDGGIPDYCDTAILVITSTAIPNAAPLAINDTYSVNEDLTLTALTSILLNDSDPDLNNLAVNTVPLNPPLNGSLSLNANGTFSYIPNPNFNGVDSFVYQVCDDGNPSLCDSAIVSINVNSINDAPIVVDDSVTTIVNIAVLGDVIVNDSDVDGPNATFSLLTSPSNGTVILNANGTFTYTPNTGFTGIDSFSYSLCDGGTPNLCATATVIITINPLPPNQAPIANGDFVITNEDTQISGSLATNDSDPEASTLVYTVFSGATTNGTLAISSSGNFIYVPAANYSGTDSYTYTMCDTAIPALCDTAILTIQITSVNDAPIAKNDTATILQNTSANGNLILNDTDVEATTLTATLLVLPINGTVLVNQNGNYTYTPSASFVGTDIFSYILCDGGTPILCDTALVIINVNAPPCAGYTANSDAATTSEDLQVVIAQLLNDNVVITNLTVGISTSALNGIVVVNANNTITYTPNLNFNGTDTFIYTVGRATGPLVCDTALVTVLVTSVNDAPIAVNDAVVTSLGNSVSGNVVSNDLDVDGPLLSATILVGTTNGTLIFNATGSFTYTPFAGFLGSDSFTYILCDGANPALCDTALVSITVNGQICAGYIALPDTASLSEDGTITISVLSNDTVVISNVGILITFNPANGTILLNSNNTISYTPNSNYNGPDSFVYGVLDTALPFPAVCDTALVLLHVNSVNDAPLANSDFFPTNEGQTLITTVKQNDSDADSDSLSATVMSQPQNGLLVFQVDGTFTYTPNPLYTGTDSFIYTLCDTGIASLCDTAIVFIKVLKINKIPVATDDTVTVKQGESAIGNVLLNDSDPDLSDLISVALIAQAPIHGVLTMASNGTYKYTSDELYFGVDSFAYEVCDDNVFTKQCDVGIVRITILETPFTVPNAFSPDGDNINDLFIIKQIQAFPENELRVYNRWGNLVYAKKGYDNSWNGKANVGAQNDELPAGSYFYTLNFNDGITEIEQGYIVIRK